MKKTILSTLFFFALLSLKAQQDTTKKDYLIKYEVLTNKGEQASVLFFDKDGKNAGTIANEQWTYSFTTTDKNQIVQLSTMRGSSGGKKFWLKANIYVNNKLIKSIEDKFLGTLGPNVQIILQDVK